MTKARDGTASEGGLRRQLLRAARGSVLVRVAALAATMGTSIVLARALGVDGYGTYAFVYALVTLLALPSQVGIPTLLVRETAKTHATGEWARMRGLWRWATRTILTTSLAVAALAALGVLVFRDEAQDPARLATLAAGLVLVPLIALGNARGAALRGLRRIVSGQLPETVVRPLLLMAFVGAAWAIRGAVAPATAMALHVLAGLLAFAFGGWLLWRARPAETAGVEPDLAQAPAWWRSALPLALIAGMQVVGAQSGVILLGLFRDGPDVGIYKVATSAATIALFGLQTANMVTGPYIARLHATGEKARLQKVASGGALVSGAITLPVFLAFAFGGEWLIARLYGDAFTAAYVPLVIVAAGQVFNALFGSVGQLLNMTGHERDAARWLGVASIGQVLLGLALVPSLGMVGAAVSASCAVVAWNIAFWRLALARTGIDGSVFGLLRRVPAP